MAGRKIPAEVQSIFQRYVDGNVRRLTKDEALKLLASEFQLEGERAEQLFHHFDADQNGFLSLWEFQHFYNVIGNKAAEIVEKFEAMDLDNNGYLDEQEARKGLSQMTTSDGQLFQDKEVDFFLKTATVKAADSSSGGEATAGPTRIDIAQFADLLARLKMYKRRK